MKTNNTTEPVPSTTLQKEETNISKATHIIPQRINRAPAFSRFENDLFSLAHDLFDDFWANPSFITERNWRPTDIDEDNENYYIEIELPRFKREQIQVLVEKGHLKVIAERDQASYVRTFQTFDADIENADVKLVDGVLYITIKKYATVNKAKQITIK